MATQISNRRTSLASTSTTSSRSSTESFLDLVKSSLEAAAWVQKTSNQINRSASITTSDTHRERLSDWHFDDRAALVRAASDKVCDEVVGMLFQCSQCVIKSASPQRTTWSPAKTTAPKTTPNQFKKTVTTKASPKADLSASLLTYLTAHLTHARRQNICLNTLTVTTNHLTIRQLRRLTANPNITISHPAIGHWELRIATSYGPFKLNIIHSQLRSVAKRLKADHTLTLEKLSKAIVALGKGQGGEGVPSGKKLTDLYLLRAYFGVQVWLHEQVGQHQGKRLWYEIAAVSFVEPYIAICRQAREAARLGRRLGMGDEEAEVGLVNEVLLQVVSPFAGMGA